MAIPEKIKQAAGKVRKAIYGQEVRESIAEGLETGGEVADEAKRTAEESDNRSKDVQNRFTDQIAGTTNSDEVIDARRPYGKEGYQTLGQRLDRSDETLEKQVVSVGDVSFLGTAPTDLSQSLTGRGLNVKDFGAKGDGVTDDSEAIKNAIKYVLITTGDKTDEKVSIYFPAGTYNIESNKIFSDYDLRDPQLVLKHTVRRGWTFRGENRWSTKLRLITNGEEKWFYDNESITNQIFSHIDFEQIGFTADDKMKGNGFKQWSQGGEKQFKFHKCLLDLGILMQFEGIGNADLNRLDHCDLRSHNIMFVFNNNQAVSTEVHGSDFLVYKDFIHVKKGGGGSFRVFGGSYEGHQHPEHKGDHYMFNMDSGANLGTGNCDFNFNDLRVELHGANKKIALTTNDNKPLNLNFTRCQFGTVNGGEREVVFVQSNKRVFFDNCILPDEFTYRVYGTFFGIESPLGAMLMFKDCNTGTNKDLPERVFYGGDNYRAVSIGSYRTASATTLNINVQDFDYGWRNMPPKSVLPITKGAPIKQARIAFPSPGEEPITIKMPKEYLVKHIYIHKPSRTDSSSSSYNLIFGNKEAGAVWEETGSKPFYSEHLIDNRTVRLSQYRELHLWAEGTATAKQSGGFAYIEYI